VQRDNDQQIRPIPLFSRRKFLAATAATAAAALAACAPAAAPSPTAAPAKPAEPAKPAAGAPAATSAPAAAAKPAEAAKAPAAAAAKIPAGDVKIKFWHQESDPKSVKSVEDMAAEFKKLYSNVTVEPTVLGWADMETKLLAAIAAGAPPELVDGFNQGMAWGVGRDLVRPADDMYEFINAKTPFYPLFIDWARWNGHVWGLQWTWGTDMLLIRKDLSDQAGLKEPTTWAEWLEWGKALTKGTDQYGIHLAGNASLWFNEDVFEFVGGNAGKLWDANGMPALVSEEMNATLEYYKSLTAAMPPGWLADGYVETMNTMALGKAASAKLWGRTIGYLSQYAPADKQTPEVYKMIQMPLGPKGTKRITQSMDDTIIVYQNSPYPEVAAEFIKQTLFKRENIRDFCLTVPVHLNPSIKGVDDDPVFKDNALVKKWAPWIEVQYKNLNEGVGRPLFVIEESDKTVPWLTDVANAGVMGELVTNVVQKGMSPADSMKAGQERAMKVVNDAKAGIKKA
jgi:multiple sugar transport system substrate-binding protein